MRSISGLRDGTLRATGSCEVAGCGLWGDVAFGLRAFAECICGPHIGLALNTAGRWGFYPHRFAGHDVMGAMRLAGHLVVGYVDGADPRTMWQKDLWACEPLAPSRAGHGKVEVRNSAGRKWSRAPSSAGHRVSVVLLCGPKGPLGLSSCGPLWILAHAFAGRVPFWRRGVRAGECLSKRGCGPSWRLLFGLAGREPVVWCRLRANETFGRYGCGPHKPLAKASALGGESWQRGVWSR